MILTPELIDAMKGAVEDCGFASVASFNAMRETVDHWRKRAEEAEALVDLMGVVRQRQAEARQKAMLRIAELEAKLAGMKQEWRVNYINGEGVSVDGYIFTSKEDRDEWIKYAKNSPYAYSDLLVQVRYTLTSEWEDVRPRMMCSL